MRIFPVSAGCCVFPELPVGGSMLSGWAVVFTALESWGLCGRCVSIHKVSLVGLVETERISCGPCYFSAGAEGPCFWMISLKDFEGPGQGSPVQDGVRHGTSGIEGRNSGRSVLVPQPLERFVSQIWKTQF